jgi:hypothetical protein
MNELNRTDFLKVAGSGSAALLAGAGLHLSKYAVDRSGQLTFQAAAGLPDKPLPSYATQLLDGRVDLSAGTGLVTARVLAGHPGDTGSVGLPGLARVIRITSVDVGQHLLRLTGRVEDRSQLRRGESPNVEIVIDEKNGLVQAPFLGRHVDHRLLKA